MRTHDVTEHTHSAMSTPTSNVPSLQFWSIIACPSLTGIPSHLTGGQLMKELQRLEPTYVDMLRELTKRRISDLDEYTSVDEMIEAEGMREYYARLAFVRRIDAAYDRLSPMIRVNDRRERILKAVAGFDEFAHCAARFDVTRLLNKVEFIATTCEEDFTYYALSKEIHGMCADEEGFVRRVFQAASECVDIKDTDASIEDIKDIVHDVITTNGLRIDTLWETRRRLLQLFPTPAMVTVLFAPELKWIPTWRFLPVDASLREDVAREEKAMTAPGALTWQQMSRLAVMQLVKDHGSCAVIQLAKDHGSS